jgi:hypothetical protein
VIEARHQVARAFGPLPVDLRTGKLDVAVDAAPKIVAYAIVKLSLPWVWEVGNARCRSPPSAPPGETLERGEDGGLANREGQQKQDEPHA